MRKNRSVLCAIGLTALLCAPVSLVSAAPQASGASGQSDKETSRRPGTNRQVAKVGEKAPMFRLKDTEGKTHSLDQYKGKTVVLQWINPQCPVCVRVTSSNVVKSMITQMKAADPNVVHLAINSTHFMEPAESAAYMKKHELTIAALDDRSGRVGRMYNAKRTPHMYVIDGEGILRYNGAIDNDRSGTKGDDRINYVVNAVTAIANGDTVTPDTTESYGCSVKYGEQKPASPEGRGSGDRRGGEGRGEGRGGDNGRMQEMLKRFDKDGDGKLSDEERQAAREEAMKEFDTNGDGKLDDDERAKMRESRRRRGGGGGGRIDD